MTYELLLEAFCALNSVKRSISDCCTILGSSTKQLEDQITLRIDQLESQKKETKSAMDVLAEAAKEMERIRYKKK